MTAPHFPALREAFAEAAESLRLVAILLVACVRDEGGPRAVVAYIASGGDGAEE